MATVRVYTTAPQVYDWGWTTVLNARFATETRTGDYLRLVEVEDEYHANHQVARYKSGMYFTMMEHEFVGEMKRKTSWIHGIIKPLPNSDENQN